MKICLICFGFSESNIRLQPWRYMYEICRRMKDAGNEVKIITDGNPSSTKESIEGISICRLKKITLFPLLRNDELIQLIEKDSPHIIIWSLGATSIFSLKTIRRMGKPIIGLWMGTTYDFRYIISLGIRELIRNYRSLNIIIISSLLPKRLINTIFKVPNLKKIIVLNKNNKQKLLHYGCPCENISVVPPGIDIDYLETPDLKKARNLKRNLKLEENSFVVLYFGSPLSLRGTDTLIESIILASREIPSLRLIILSRRGQESLESEESYIKEIYSDISINQKIRLISGFQDKKIIKNFIALSDVVALPFKVVQSDTPISILEAMAIGKPVISTRLDGIPELLDGGRGCLINPNDPKDLADKLVSLYTYPHIRDEIGKNAKDYIQNYSSWDQAIMNFISLIEDITNKEYNLSCVQNENKLF